MKKIFLSIAVVGVLGVAVSLPVGAAEPTLLRVLVVHSDDVPAYAHEIEALRTLYKKEGVAVTIDAFQMTAIGPSKANAIVHFWVANLATLGKMDEMTRTQPDLVAEMKKISRMQQLIFNGLYEKLTRVGVPPASLSVRAAEPAVMRGLFLQSADLPADLPAYVREIEALEGLYKKQGLAVSIDVYQGTYAGTFAGNVDVEIRVANLAALAKMDEMTRTQPELAAQMKKIGGMQRKESTSSTLYTQVTP